MPESSSHEGTDLSKFQLRLLALLAARDDVPKGLTVQDEVSAYYGEEVNHGRLYPNLTMLSEDGYVEIGQKDKRTNS